MRPWPALLLLPLLACASPPGGTLVEGSAGGASFQGPEAVYTVQTDYLDRGPVLPDQTLVLLADGPDPCSALFVHGFRAQGDVVTLRSLVSAPDGGARPSLFLALDEEHLGAADRSLSHGLEADLDPVEPCPDAGSVDPVACRLLRPQRGSARLEQTRDRYGEGAWGSFDLDFGDAGHLAGRFSARRCDKLHAGVSPSCASAGGGWSAWAGLAALALLARPALRRGQPTSGRGEGVNGVTLSGGACQRAAVEGRVRPGPSTPAFGLRSG